MKALYFDKFGDSEVLKYGEQPEPVLTADEVLVKTSFIGLNFADIYRRRGEYTIAQRAPYINGYEGAGFIVESRDKWLIGKRVLFVDVPFANASFVAVPKAHLIILPDDISLELAASIGLQGLTADFLAHDLAKDQQGAKVFISGVTGGVGQILSQMLRADGMSVYGSASKEKVATAIKLGVKEVFPSREFSWVEQQSQQFDTVYDGIGSTLNQSIKLLKNRGKVVLFGMAGGQPPQIDFVNLFSQSKNILTGDLWHFLTSYEERNSRAKRLFNYFLEEKITITPPTIFYLSDGKAAHDYLEKGKNVGKILLVP